MTVLPEHEERFVRQYVDAEMSEDGEIADPVELIQKVGSRRVLGITHELYDVHCRESRWWVITDLTNMYNQEDFPQIETAFVYHIGVCLVMRERSRSVLDSEEREVIEGARRRFAQAADAMDDARESQDFQAVGVMCREALLAMVRESHEAPWVGAVDEAPKTADFKGWMAILVTRLASSRPRAYLAALGERTWDLAVWLQHKTDATAPDAELVLDATSHLLANFATFVLRLSSDAPDQCPRCESYRVAEAGERYERDDVRGWRSWRACGACAWESEASESPWPTLPAYMSPRT